MRRKLRVLAHTARAALLGVVAAAAATIWIWGWRPDQVERLERWLERKLQGPWHTREGQARTEADAARAEALYAALVEDLDHVRREDRLAGMVTDCYQRLSRFAEARSDLVAAADWMRRCVAFDDHNLLTRMRLGDLLCQRPETLTEGLDGLRALQQQFPNIPNVGGVLVQCLGRAGLAPEAFAVIDRQRTALTSNLWLVTWDVGTGLDLQERRAETVAVTENGILRLRFTIDDEITALQIRPPGFAGLQLEEPQLLVAQGESIAPIDPSTDPRIELFQMRRSTGLLWTLGDSGPSLTLRWPAAQPAGTTFELRGRVIATTPAALLEPLGMAAFAELQAQLLAAGKADDAARLGTLRALAAADEPLEVFWTTDGEPFRASASMAQPPATQQRDSGVAFTLHLPLAASADQLRLDLPDSVGTRFTFAPFELRGPGGSTTIDAAAVAIQPHNVVRQDGEFAITGADPYFSFRLPALQQIDEFVARGTIR